MSEPRDAMSETPALPSLGGSAPTLDAGRELNAMVAEQVMGWEPRGPHPIFGTPVYHHETGPMGRGDSLLMNFSTHIVAAWDVVEEMNRRGWIVNVHNRQMGRWACHVAFPAPDYRQILEVADTAPLAICRAALRATLPSEGARP